MESFGALLQTAFPEVDGDLADQLRDVVKQVGLTNKKGTVAVTLEVEPNGDNRIMLRVPTVTTKAPQPNRGSALFYMDDSGNLSRRDPRQPNLEGLEER